MSSSRRASIVCIDHWYILSKIDKDGRMLVKMCTGRLQYFDARGGNVKRMMLGRACLKSISMLRAFCLRKSSNFSAKELCGCFIFHLYSILLFST